MNKWMGKVKTWLAKMRQSRTFTIIWGPDRTPLPITMLTMLITTMMLILLIILIILLVLIMLIRQSGGHLQSGWGLTGAPDPTGRCHLQGPCALLTWHSWKSLSSLLKIQKRLYMYIFSCKSWGTGWVLCCFGKCWICDLKRTNYLNRCAIFWVDNALFIDLMEPYATCLWM